MTALARHILTSAFGLWDEEMKIVIVNQALHGWVAGYFFLTKNCVVLKQHEWHSHGFHICYLILHNWYNIKMSPSHMFKEYLTLSLLELLP